MRKVKAIQLCLVMLLSCTSPDTFEIEHLTRKYSDDALSLFSESGFVNERVLKWNNNIKISSTGSSTNNDLNNLDSLIEEFEPLLNGLTITRVKEHGNIEFNFTTDFVEEGHIMALGKTTRKVKTFSKGEMTKANVYINPAISESSRKETMRHEFMHALGLTHSATIENTILSDRTVYKSIEELEKSMLYEKISGLDEALVRMLYEDSIPFGLKKSEFKKQLERLETKE